MDEKLKETINKVILLTQQNEEFNKELRKRLEINSPAKLVSQQSNIKDDVLAIREALEIRANKSITYDFIDNQRLRDQLVIDNLRMENAALNLTEKEANRFYAFCVNAFYQIENVVNYYFHVLYPDINDLLKCIEDYTSQEEQHFQFHRKNTERHVGDIAIASKLNAICNILFPGDEIKISCSQLRSVRNEGEHRCMTIIQKQEVNNSLYKFFKFNTFNGIRSLLFRLVNEIKLSIEEVNKPHEIEAEITSVLPSACFVKCQGKTFELPIAFLPFVKGKMNGERIVLVVKANKMLSIKSDVEI